MTSNLHSREHCFLATQDPHTLHKPGKREYSRGAINVIIIVIVIIIIMVMISHEQRRGGQTQFCLGIAGTDSQRTFCFWWLWWGWWWWRCLDIWAPTVKEPFVFDKEDDKAKGDDTMSMVLMKRKMVTMSPILSVLLVMMSWFLVVDVVRFILLIKTTITLVFWWKNCFALVYHRVKDWRWDTIMMITKLTSTDGYPSSSVCSQTGKW